MITQLSSLTHTPHPDLTCDSVQRMSTMVVDLLAARPEDELREMLDKAAAQLRRLEVEVEQLEEALARQVRRSARAGGSARSDTRQRVLETIRDHGGPMSPSQVIAALNAQDAPTPKSGAIHNMMGRLVREGDLVREGGQYDLPGRNGVPIDEVPFVPDENGTDGSPSTTPPFQEAT
jgi:hypothetical protein